MTRHMTLEDMTGDCKQLSDIKALHGRRADRLRHETEIHGPPSSPVARRGQESATRANEPVHCGWSCGRNERAWGFFFFHNKSFSTCSLIKIEKTWTYQGKTAQYSTDH